MPPLAERFTVLAPDLLGHGQSAKPRGDYSLGAYASGVRDLLVALGHEQRDFRRALAGRGRGDAALLPVPRAMRAARAGRQRWPRSRGQPPAALGDAARIGLRPPGSHTSEAARSRPRVDGLLKGFGLTSTPTSARWRAGMPPSPTAKPARRSSTPCEDRRSRRPEGQRHRSPLSRRERALPDHLGRPRQDHPARAWRGDAHRLVPGSHLEVFPDSGHFPQLDEPQRFVETVTGFIESTEPSDYDAARLRELLQRASG